MKERRIRSDETDILKGRCSSGKNLWQSLVREVFFSLVQQLSCCWTVLFQTSFQQKPSQNVKNLVEVGLKNYAQLFGSDSLCSLSIKIIIMRQRRCKNVGMIDILWVPECAAHSFLIFLISFEKWKMFRFVLATQRIRLTNG